MKNIGLIILLAGGAFGYLYYSGYLNSIRDHVIPPNPTVVSNRCDDMSTDIGNFEYSLRVITNIRNLGGSGNVVVEAQVTQGDELWTKSEMLYMEPHQTIESIIVFDEVALFNETPRCSVKIYAHGK
ncbi:hypothetical protein ACQV5M_17375 [Leptospira sp. SA-E8]|uniref:hypothetical protein n=1 Tax=Leptospira sp. SA-E8 TaxID=3422259 RepID=UPI003EC006E6